MSDVLRLVSLQLADPAGYRRYRMEMAPHLARHGGRFVLDVDVARAHIHPAEFVPERVLLIAFPSAEAARAFVEDEAYQAVRRRWFDPSVARTEALVLA